MQQCAVGLVPIRRERRAPGLRRAAAARAARRAPALLARVAAALGLKAQQIVAAQLLDNGPVWLGLLLDDADTVLALKPDHRALKAAGAARSASRSAMPSRDERAAR